MHGLYDGDFIGYKIATSAELDAALREAVVAVDANVLLDLYRFRPQTSRDLIKTLRSLGDRLVVPHQALREFWRRRQRSQDSPGIATRAATDALDKSGRSMCDALATWARAVGVDDDEVSDLTVRVDDLPSYVGARPVRSTRGFLATYGRCDHDCDQDTSEQAGGGETDRECIASSAEASMGVSDEPGRVATAFGLLITGDSRGIIEI